MCRDVSCIIICFIENKMLGIVFYDKISKEIIQCVAITFVDDTDFMTDGENSQAQMQSILDIYNKLYGAIGGHIEETKTTYYAWI